MLSLFSDTETAVFNKNMAKKNHNVFYEARLLSCIYEKHHKAKKVYCYISPKVYLE